MSRAFTSPIWIRPIRLKSTSQPRTSRQPTQNQPPAVCGDSLLQLNRNMSNNGDKSRSKRRREAKLKQKDDALGRGYAGITFSARPSSGRPATPHRHFESSYTCEGRTASTSTGTDDTPGSASSSERDCGQVIHRHANGLCVVTAGDIIKKACSAISASNSTGDASNTSVGVRQVEFRIAPAEGQSVGSKRRKRMGKKSKKKKGSGNDDGGDGDGDGGNDVEGSSGATRPSDVLAVVELNCGTRIELNCCVLGTLLEINTRLVENPSLLLSDPLLDGYLAVILPQGRLPIS